MLLWGGQKSLFVGVKVMTIKVIILSVVSILLCQHRSNADVFDNTYPSISIDKQQNYIKMKSSVDGCSVEWKIYDDQSINKNVIKQSIDCSSPLTGKLYLFDSLIKKCYGQEKYCRNIDTLFWGPIADPDLSFDLAVAANSTKNLNAIKNRKMQNEWVLFVVKENNLFEKFVSLFKSNHLDLVPYEVDNISFVNVSRLPFSEKLLRRNVLPSEVVPYSPLIWFRLTGSSSLLDE